MMLFKLSFVLCIFAIFNGTNGHKVDTEVQQELDKGNKPNVIVECQKHHSRESSTSLKEIKETSQNPDISRSQIMTKLVQQKQNTVLSSLEPVVAVLRKLRVKFKILWISFEIFIPEATAKVISQLVKIENVVWIRLEQVMPHIPPQPPGSQPPPQGNQTWNIGLIDARCPGIKCLGKGVTVGFIDSGVRATHEEFRDNWVGNTSPFGYMDSFPIPRKNCNPEDFTGYGTGIVGAVVGKTIGVAPEAQWMMCRSCGTGGCTESRIKICAEWLACPYECDDETEEKITRNCAMRPHVISNSWGFSLASVWYLRYTAFYDYIEHWNSLGIISVVPAGDYGPGCNTIGFPAAYDNVIDVGSVNPSVTLSEWSSVGPSISRKPLNKDSIAVGFCSSKASGNHTSACALIKPTVVAPGDYIISAGTNDDTELIYIDGTKLAAAHVAGVIALMICSNPAVRWNYKLAYEILTTTTDTSRIDLLGERQNKDDPRPINTNARCNTMLSNICNTFPNNMYGYGLVSACKAVAASEALSNGSNFGWN